jgi:hypothetical protein
VRIFREFEQVIDDTLKNGRIAEIAIKLPILKIYKKDFVKSQAQLQKKGLVLSEEDLRKVTDQKPEWTKKRLPHQVVNQGFLDEKEFDIAHIADGFHTISEIAEEAGVPEAEVDVMIDKLDKLGLLKFIEIK